MTLTAEPRDEFPDVELCLVDELSDLADAGTYRPADLQTRLPFIHVHRIGGTANDFTMTARVDVDVFTASTSREGSDIAQAVLSRILEAIDLGGGLIIDTPPRGRVEVAPNEVVTDDDALRLWNATYVLGYRRY